MVCICRSYQSYLESHFRSGQRLSQLQMNRSFRGPRQDHSPDSRCCAQRTLAEHGASVLQVIYTHGYEHSLVYTYANLGTASTRLNFNKAADRRRMWPLIADAHVYLDSYRPGAISKFGFTDDAMVEVNPQLIICHLRCYGTTGPWAAKPGFDMQGSASSGLMGVMGDGRP